MSWINQLEHLSPTLPPKSHSSSLGSHSILSISISLLPTILHVFTYFSPFPTGLWAPECLFCVFICLFSESNLVTGKQKILTLTLSVYYFWFSVSNFTTLYFLFKLLNTYDRSTAAKSLQSCLTVRPHRQQPTRLSHPWDSPGKNTGVGCHFLLQCMKVKCESEVTRTK